MSFCWTVDTLQAARRLYLEEGLSAAETARRLGVTRSALIAKAHRMGWAAERDPALAAANMVRGGRALARSLREAQSHPGAAAPLPADPGPVPESRPRSWLERRPGECAFPVAGDGEAVISCCAPCGLRSYCPPHTAVMYIRRSPAQQKALQRIAEWVDQLERPAAKRAEVR